MKRFIRTAITIAMLFMYAACQKEVSDVIPVDGPTPTDSTSTDSTGTTILDSLRIISFSPDSGRVGSEVRITGTGFDTIAANNLVLINTTAAKVVSATKTALTIEVLEGTTTGKISVAANGKMATSITNFAVLQDSVVSGTNVWTRKADCPLEGGTFVNGFSIGSNGYFFDGFTLWQYNPATNKWSPKTDLPSETGHRFGFCFVIGNKAYIGLGANGEAEDITDTTGSQFNYKEVWAYDATQEKWTQKRDFPGAARVVPFSFSVKGTGYVGGGDPSNGNVDKATDFWKYDPAADSWTQLNDFPRQNPIGFTGFSLAGSGYVLEAGPGNPTAPVSGDYSDILWKYNDATDTWEQKASLPTRNFISAVAFSIGSKAYAALGVVLDPDNPPVEREDFWEYDPLLNTWTQKADAGDKLRWLGSGFAVGGKGYVGIGTGDYYEDLKADFWEYTPE